MCNRRQIVLLDGPVGTELSVRGVDTPAPAWSANALDTAPGVISDIHRDYAAAGAVVHTAATFRTRLESLGERWEDVARRAVRLARQAVPEGQWIAGSVAPVEDCYRPDLSPRPRQARISHELICDLLADAGVDLLLCETFSCTREAQVAVECALDTGLQTWAAFSPGPDGSLMTPRQMGSAAAAAASSGASAVLVNCIAASRALPYVEALARAVGSRHRVWVGAYANAGGMDEGLGWGANPQGAIAHAALAREWVESGASIVGGCCGTGPGHIAELWRTLAREYELWMPSSRKATGPLDPR